MIHKCDRTTATPWWSRIIQLQGLGITLRVTLYPACLCQIIQPLEKEASQTQTHILTQYCALSFSHPYFFFSIVLVKSFLILSFLPSCDYIIFVRFVFLTGLDFSLPQPLFFSKRICKGNEDSALHVFLLLFLSSPFFSIFLFLSNPLWLPIVIFYHTPTPKAPFRNFFHYSSLAK